MAKADNLLAVLWLLRSRRRMTAEAIAAELEISPRTVYRYVDALCASGVPVVAESGPEGGYYLSDGFRGAPLFFEPTELVALFQAALYAEQSGHPYSKALQGALAKVRRNLAPEQAERLEQQIRSFTVRASPRGGPVEPWLGKLQEALAASVTLEMAYQKPSDEEPEVRLVDPYGLSYQNGRWFLVGFCHKRQAMRDFRVDRIRSLTLTGQPFARPPNFSLEAYYTGRAYEGEKPAPPGTPVTIHIEGEPPVIEALCEHWSLQHRLVERSARSVRFAVDPAGLERLPDLLLHYGTGLKVLEPAALRASLAALAHAWARHHEAES